MRLNRPDEFQLIERINAIAGLDDSVCSGIGDDAAILTNQHFIDRRLVTCMDTLVEGRHFFVGVDPGDLGHKALAVNLSDLAAMGATPHYALLSLTLPDADEGWLDTFLYGFNRLAQRFQVRLVGGDTCCGPLAISVTLIGSLPKNLGLLRSGANVGDWIAVSGELGAAGFAVHQIKNNKACGNEILARLHRPTPRLDLGQSLLSIASSCIDISDGLIADLSHILKASDCGAKLRVDQLPISNIIDDLVSSQHSIALALTGGDDYELCFTYPPSSQPRINQISQDQSIGITTIGSITEEKELSLIDQSELPVDIPVKLYEHFKTS